MARQVMCSRRLLRLRWQQQLPTLHSCRSNQIQAGLMVLPLLLLAQQQAAGLLLLLQLQLTRLTVMWVLS